MRGVTKMEKKRLIVIVSVLVLAMLLLVKKEGIGDTTVTRTIDPPVGSLYDEFKVTVTVVASQDISGILTENIPAGYVINLSSTKLPDLTVLQGVLDYSSGTKIEVPFVLDMDWGNSGTLIYYLRAETSDSAVITGTHEWGDEFGNPQTESILGDDSIDLCQDGDQDGYGVGIDRAGCLYPAYEDCNDGDSGINPGADELCNNIDDNCGGGIDENLQQGCSNANEFGNCTGIETCSAGVWGGCDAPTPEDEAIKGCDLADNNCDGQIDESQNTPCDDNCDGVVCSSELLDYMSEWLVEHDTILDCDNVDGCVSTEKLLTSMQSWLNTHNDARCLG